MFAVSLIIGAQENSQCCLFHTGLSNATCLQYPIIGTAFDHAERTFVRGNLRDKNIVHKAIMFSPCQGSAPQNYWQCACCMDSVFPIALVSITFILNGYSHDRNRNRCPHSTRHLHHYSLLTRVQIWRWQQPDTIISHDEEWTLQCVVDDISVERSKKKNEICHQLLLEHCPLFTALFCSVPRFNI